MVSLVSHGFSLVCLLSLCYVISGSESQLFQPPILWPVGKRTRGGDAWNRIKAKVEVRSYVMLVCVAIGDGDVF